MRDLEPAHDVGANQLMPTRIDAVRREIARCPIEVGVGQVDGLRGDGAACRRIHGKAPCVGEQVQHPPTLRTFAHDGPQRAMIEEEPGIEMRLEVDNEAQSRFNNGEILPARSRRLVLLALAALLARLHDNRRWEHP